MKEKIMILIFGLLLVITGCSNDDESIKDTNNYLTTITVKSGSDSRVSYDGYDVLWKDLDLIALSNISEPESYYVYRLTEGAGTTTGTFEINSMDLPSMTNQTYFVYYPVNAKLWNFKGITTPITSFVQKDNTPNHLADFDLMVSEPTVIGYPFDSKSFTLKHLLSMVKFNVKSGRDSDVPYLLSIIMESASGRPCFASSFRQEWSSGDSNPYKIIYEANNLCVGFNSPRRLWTNSYQPLYLLARQSELCDLKLSVIFQFTGVFYTASTNYRPTSILEPGKIYEKNLILTVDRESPNYSSLVVEP